MSQRPSERRRSLGRRTEDRAFEALAIQDAFVALTDGIILAGPDGIIVSANPAAFRVLGEEKLKGRRFEDLLLVTGAATVQERDGHHVRRTWFPREDRMGVLEIVSTSIGDRGVLHTVRDVTAQAELLRLKEDFLLQVAHELRTPIAALSATLDLLVDDALSMPPAQLTAMVATLRRSALRLEHLVENLLDAGSIEPGREAPEAPDAAAPRLGPRPRRPAPDGAGPRQSHRERQPLRARSNDGDGRDRGARWLRPGERRG